MAAMVCCGFERRKARFAFSAAMNFAITPELDAAYDDVVVYAPTANGRLDRLAKTRLPIFVSDWALGGWNSAATAAPLRIADSSSAWVTRNLRPTELGLIPSSWSSAFSPKTTSEPTVVSATVLPTRSCTLVMPLFTHSWRL